MPVYYLIGNGSVSWTPVVTGTAVVELWGAGQCGTVDTGGAGAAYVSGTISITAGVPISGTLGAPTLGAGAIGGDTSFAGLLAPGGGSSSTAIGTTIHVGGAGGVSGLSSLPGGGGAGGPHAAGAAGGAGVGSGLHSGSGGGGSDGGGVGGQPTASLSGAGGTNHAGQPGGVASAGTGNNGINLGSGGAGGFGASDSSTSFAGGNGAPDFDLGGGGGGGGAAPAFPASSAFPGAGGTPGGGSAPAYQSSGAGGPFAFPGWGEIKITTPGGGAQFFYYGSFVPSNDTGFLVEPEGNETVVASAITTLAGTLAATEGADTIAATAKSTVSGSLSIAEAADALSAAGSVVGNFLVITEASDTISAAGAILVGGAVGLTEAPDTLVGVAALTGGAALILTEASDTLVAAGAPTISGGLLAITEQNDVFVGAAAISGIVGQLITTEVNDAVYIVGQITGPIPTQSFDPSVSDIGLYVLHRVGVSRVMVTTEHLADLQMAANFVLSDMSTTQPNLWSVALNQIALSQGVVTYILPPNVLLVLDSFIRTTVGGVNSDRIVFGVSRDEYAAYPNKLIQQPPTVYWADRSEPIKINVYPAPDGHGPYTLFYYAVQRDNDAAVGADAITSLPFRFLNAFKDMLTAELAPTLAPAKAAMFAQIAEQSKMRAFINDRENVPLRITPGLNRYYRG